jgi:hypothetical protein
MSFIQSTTRIDRKLDRLVRNSARICRLSVIAASMALCAQTALAADRGSASGANSAYQQERSNCLSGKSAQDRATCLREAGAAREEARRGGLDNGQARYEQNALTRCEGLPAADREDCQRRIKGEGSVSGSVTDGGVYRELVTRETPSPAATSDRDSKASGVSSRDAAQDAGSK